MDLFYGDATPASTFTKVGFLEDGGRVTAKYKPTKGKKFVVLLLGECDTNATECDIDGMLDALGYVPKGEAVEND